MLRVVEPLFSCSSPRSVYTCGDYPIQEGSKSRGPRGSNRLQTPCELPEGNLGLIGSALPQHPWQRWTPSKTCHIDETDSVASRSMNVCSGGRRRRAADPSWILFPWGKCLCAFKEHWAAQTIFNTWELAQQGPSICVFSWSVFHYKIWLFLVEWGQKGSL